MCRVPGLLNEWHSLLSTYFTLNRPYTVIISRLWETPGVRVEISPLGRWEGLEGINRAMVKFHKFIGAGKPGCLWAHNQTTPVIEVAGDGKTAKGVWMLLNWQGQFYPDPFEDPSLERRSLFYRYSFVLIPFSS